MKRLRLSYSEQNKPTLAILVATLISSTSTTETVLILKDANRQSPSLSLIDGSEQCEGDDILITRVLLSSSQALSRSRSLSELSEIEKYLSGVGSCMQIGELNNKLLLKTFLVGHSLSVADLASFVALGQQWRFCPPPPTVAKFPHAMRHWHHIAQLPIFAPLVAQWSSTGSQGDKKQAVEKKPGSYEGILPGAEMGKVCCRFPPEPSGYLHIGHAKAALLNAYYSKLYKGKLILRFDDTNPAKEKMEFQDAIKKDLSLLEVTPDVVTHTSDHFPKLIELMTRLLAEGKMYADDMPLERMRQERMDGIESECRNNSVEENMRRWQSMLAGTPEGARNCIRAKLDMQSKNKCLRDPVMYRCILDIPHHITGFAYKVYPMYDFACPIIDSWEGVTHAMRTNEYADRIPQYEWVQKTAGVRTTIIYEFSRLNFVNTVLSKRKLQWFVDNKIVENWADPRFPTVRGIRRRGLTVEALLEFLLEQGPSKNANMMEWDKLWVKNKSILDPKVPRFMAVAADAVPFHLADGPQTPHSSIRDLHPKNPAVGRGPIVFASQILLERDDAVTCAEGEEVTLMRWGNAVVDKMERDANGTITSMLGHLHLEGDVKSTKKKLHWLPLVTGPMEGGVDCVLTPCLLREFDHIITKKKLDENDKLEDFVAPNSVFDTPAVGDPLLKGLKEDDCIQLERRGYFRCDRPHSATDPMVLIKIPDGKTKSMSTVSTKVDAATLAKGGAHA